MRGKADMTGRRILFGVGATKAGTSWLHEWLSGHPECHFRSIKELHYFDALEEGRLEARIRALEEERVAVMARGGSASRIADLGDCIALFRQAGDAAYLAYLDRDSGRCAVTGDVTPAYALLPVERLKAMAGLGETRFLYILRDPVARLWSHVRMIARRRDPEGRLASDRAGRVLKRTIRGDEVHIAERSDYRGAIERLAAAVPEDRRLFVFFEDLVRGNAARQVCGFLGIAPVPALNEVVHAGQPLEMTQDQSDAARRWLGEQYDHVERVMGRLPDAWQRAREGVTP